MKILSDIMCGLLPVSRAETGTREPHRVSLAQPRLGRDLSRLDAHGPGVTPLQHAVTMLAGLIAPPHQAIDGEGRSGCPVDERSLKDYVRAVLGVQHDETKIDPNLAPYLDELSRNESTFWAQPVTRDSTTLLCILYLADQVPGSEYGQCNHDAFMDWLNWQLRPDTRARYDCIPDDYLDAVQVSGTPETGLTLQYDWDRTNSVDVRTVRRANPQAAYLAGTYLRGIDLRGANLRGVDLRGANLRDADLRGANLRDADLRDADLRYADLRGAHLEGASLDNACLHGAYLRGVNLEGASLSVTPELAMRIVFSRDSLSGTRLVMSTEVAATLCRGHVTAWMQHWHETSFEEHLNHRNNDGQGVLKNIAGLADSCRDTKRALMRAVVGGLDRARTRQENDEVDALIPSLGDVLFDDPEYLRNYDAFSAWLVAGLLGDGSTRLDPRLGDSALEAVGGHAARLLAAEGMGAITEHSMAIYQVLYAMRQRAASATSPEVGEKWTARSQALHEQYCRVLRDALPTLMGEGGVYENERDVVLMDDDAFPLISADGQACVIMSDRYYRQLVLESGGDWDQLRCVQGSAGTFPANVSAAGEGGTRRVKSTAAVIDQFPLLHAARRRQKATEAQARMLALAGLTGELLQQFTDALTRDTGVKMTGAAGQSALIDIFAPKIEDRGWQVHLAPEHFTALQAQWRDDAPQAFAFRLLCMAALYTNCASRRVFGTETESPNALRTYAEALLRKVHELAPALLPDDKVKSWVSRLRKEGDAFDCTAVLYDLQSKHMANLLDQEAGNGPLHKVRDDMIPLAWRLSCV
jgi:hypothetical protein